MREMDTDCQEGRNTYTKKRGELVFRAAVV